MRKYCFFTSWIFIIHQHSNSIFFIFSTNSVGWCAGVASASSTSSSEAGSSSDWAPARRAYPRVARYLEKILNLYLTYKFNKKWHVTFLLIILYLKLYYNFKFIAACSKIMRTLTVQWLGLKLRGLSALHHLSIVLSWYKLDDVWDHTETTILILNILQFEIY